MLFNQPFHFHIRFIIYYIIIIIIISYCLFCFTGGEGRWWSVVVVVMGVDGRHPAAIEASSRAQIWARFANLLLKQHCHDP